MLRYIFMIFIFSFCSFANIPSTYDAFDRLVTTTDERGHTTTNEYDARGNEIEYTYDKVGNQTSAKDALGNVTTNTYDKQGNLLTTSNALGFTTEYKYNRLNQRVETIYSDGTVVKEPKNISGLPTSKIDENLNEASYSYDTTKTIPLLNKVTLANVAETSYAYDSQGRKVSQTDALNHSTTHTYSNLGKLSTETLPLGQTKSFTYDNYGKQTQINDYANKA